MHSLIGVVIIGRNEGARLTACLESVISSVKNIVYVDSGSTDNSIANAKERGVGIVRLDISIPFTAARARNEGFKHLLELEPNLSFVQFIDGDCEISKDWLKQSSEFLSNNISTAVVCGRRRERNPKASVYNQMCDIEWNTPIGETKACGGDALMRIKALQDVVGFNPGVIAGEEPELCVRIRQNGWKVWRLDCEMTMHDAGIYHFSQWWRRNIRAGYAYALGASMHGKAPEYHRVKETKRIWFWGLYLPALIITLSTFNPVMTILTLIYPLQVIRVKLKNKHIPKHGWFYALLVTVGKFPEVQGQIRYVYSSLRNKQSKIIEYKD